MFRPLVCDQCGEEWITWVGYAECMRECHKKRAVRRELNRLAELAEEHSK